MKPRGRFDIVVVFDTAYLRFTSDKTRSLPPREIVACLRKYADSIERGAQAQEKTKNDTSRT